MASRLAWMGMFGIALLAGLAARGHGAGNRVVMLASTIGPIDAGIVGALEDAFQRRTGIEVRHAGAGTGAALEMAKTGSFDQRRRRLDRPAGAAPRPPPRGPRVRKAPARLGPARRRLPARGRHARADDGAPRGPARSAHGAPRRAVLHLGARALASGLGVSRLEVADLAFGYRGRAVGRNVSFALEGGEVMCLLGPNGGGKTTLFKTVLGLLPALGGTVAIDGESLEGWSRPRVATALGYVPQAQLGLFPFSVREIVLMGRTAHLGAFATPSPRDAAVVEATLHELGIAHLAARPYTEVSGGERQLALVARALVQEARVLVMDEPTASLDFGNQVRVLSRIRALAGIGIAVILSTHDPDQAFACADRVAMLHGGTLAGLGPPDTTITRERLRAVYGVDVDVVELTLSDGRRTRTCVPAVKGR